MTRTYLAPAVAALVALLLVTPPAHAATVNRVWVSGHGTDAAGCGAPATPCRSFQFVVSNIVAPGGEIDVLDPAGYGAVTITHALSIVNDGVGTAGVQSASGNAITINAGGTDAVTLRGLSIDGLGTGSNGIAFNAGGSLTVVNCVIRHFTLNIGNGDGILIQPTSGAMSFLISNVIATDNTNFGISFLSATATSANGVMDHVIVANNGGGGVFISSSGAAEIGIINSVASNNGGAGMWVQASSAPVTVSIEDSTLIANQFTGVEADFTATVLLGRNTIVANNNTTISFQKFGYINDTSPNTLFTWGDNHITGGGGGDTPFLNTTLHPQ